MNPQARAILYAQLRSLRNRWPRAGWGTLLIAAVSAVWYLVFAAVAVMLAYVLPDLPHARMQTAAGFTLVGVFVYWQIFPLFTLSSGWSLDRSKLLVYPVPHRVLFQIAVLLRLSTAPEMLIVLAGFFIGTVQRPDASMGLVGWVCLYVAFNLLLSSAISDCAMRLVDRNRLKQGIGIFFVALTVLPNAVLLFRPHLPVSPLAIDRLIGFRFLPWWVSYSRVSGGQLLAMLLWVLFAAWFAFVQFRLTLNADPAGVERRITHRPATDAVSWFDRFCISLSRPVPKHLSNLVEAQIRSLLRMPRFRVVFVMACSFSFFVFLPFRSGALGEVPFLHRNTLPAINLYGLLLVGEVCFWNCFGFDRGAARIYFTMPFRFRDVLLAKNYVALLVVLALTVGISIIGYLFRFQRSFQAIATSILLTLILAQYFAAFGNLTSVLRPRAADPRQTFRRQNAGASSLWLLLALAVGTIPIGVAYAVGVYFHSQHLFFAVLAVDLVIGGAVYAICTQTAVDRAEAGREEIINQLTKDLDPVRI